MGVSNTELPVGSVLEGNGGKWKLGKKLGGGAFGIVYECVNDKPIKNDDGIKYAIKVTEKAKTKSVKGKSAAILAQANAASMNFKEFTLYVNRLYSHPNLSVVPLAAYGQDDKYCWVVLQKHDGTLRNFIEKHPTQTLPFSTTATIILQLLDVLQFFHSINLVYIDINLDNVMIGGPRLANGMNTRASICKVPPEAPLDSNGKRVYLVDFGLTTPITAFDKTPLPANLNGTPLFVSSAVGKKWNICARNDLESLAYLFLYMLGGLKVLPWQDAKSEDECTKLKMSATPSSLTKNINPAYSSVAFDVVSYILSLKPEDPINYDKIRSFLMPYANKNGKLDFTSVEKNDSKPVKQSKVASPSPKASKRTPVKSAPSPSPIVPSPKKVEKESAARTKLKKHIVILDEDDDVVEESGKRKRSPLSRNQSVRMKEKNDTSPARKTRVLRREVAVIDDSDDEPVSVTKEEARVEVASKASTPKSPKHIDSRKATSSPKSSSKKLPFSSVSPQLSPEFAHVLQRIQNMHPTPSKPTQTPPSKSVKREAKTLTPKSSGREKQVSTEMELLHVLEDYGVSMEEFLPAGTLASESQTGNERQRTSSLTPQPDSAFDEQVRRAKKTSVTENNSLDSEVPRTPSALKSRNKYTEEDTDIPAFGVESTPFRAPKPNSTAAHIEKKVQTPKMIFKRR